MRMANVNRVVDSFVGSIQKCACANWFARNVHLKRLTKKRNQNGSFTRLQSY